MFDIVPYADELDRCEVLERILLARHMIQDELPEPTEAEIFDAIQDVISDYWVNRVRFDQRWLM